jgi:hypothetical protein
MSSVLIKPNVRPLASSNGDTSESLFGARVGGISTCACLCKKRYVVSRGLKDGFASTAGLAGSHVCGGECKSTHQWNGARQKPAKQKVSTREGGSPPARDAVGRMATRRWSIIRSPHLLAGGSPVVLLYGYAFPEGFSGN